MRTITIRYDYSGPEADWQAATVAFIDAIDKDPEIPGTFTYQVAVADNGTSRVHWGRWDSAETLAHVQAQDYFKTFAARIGEFAGGAQIAFQAEVANLTRGW